MSLRGFEAKRGHEEKRGQTKRKGVRNRSLVISVVSRYNERKGVRNRSLVISVVFRYNAVMGRLPRAAEGGLIYHALNRANARLTIFEGAEDYDAFLGVLSEAVARYGTRLLAYCVMPNHFHLMLWPREDGELTAFMRWLTLTHTQRWHAHRGSAGTGHVYQGRFKSFPVQDDGHFLAACRYVERNAVRAGLAARAQDWLWCSLAKNPDAPPLSEWPIERPVGWAKRVNRPMTEAEEIAMRRSIVRGQPFGSEEWRAETACRLGLESSLRAIGRPRNTENGS